MSITEQRGVTIDGVPYRVVAWECSDPWVTRIDAHESTNSYWSHATSRDDLGHGAVWGWSAIATGTARASGNFPV